ncbi:MAG TPA: serine hydrolase [Planctomycetota bacterium]
MRVLILVPLLAGCAPSDYERMGRLERDVRHALAREAPETVPSLWLARFDGREVLAINPDRPVAGASTLKILLLVEAHAQGAAFPWDADTTLLAEDVVGGTGTLQHERTGSTWSWRQITRRMILESDNTAANLVLARLGMDRVNARAAALGLAVTRFERKYMDFEAQRAGRENRTTAREMGRLCMAIARREVVSPAACDEMIALLEGTSRGRIAAGVPKAIPVGHKSGWMRGLRADAGWVRVPGAPYVLSIFLDNVYEKPGAEDDRGVGAIEAVARLVFEALGPGDE